MEVRGEEGERRTRRPEAPPPRKPIEKKASFWRRGPRGKGVCRRWVREESKENEEGASSSSSLLLLVKREEEEKEGRILGWGEEEEEGGQTKAFLVGGVGVKGREEEEEERRLFVASTLLLLLLLLLLLPPPKRLERKPCFGESSLSSLDAASVVVLVFLPLPLLELMLERLLSRRSMTRLDDDNDGMEEGEGRRRNAVQ